MSHLVQSSAVRHRVPLAARPPVRDGLCPLVGEPPVAPGDRPGRPGGRLRIAYLPALTILALVSARGAAVAEMIDLTRAAVVVERESSGRERLAARMLVEEVERRSGVRWDVRTEGQDLEGAIGIAVGRNPVMNRRLGQLLVSVGGRAGSEGYQIVAEPGGLAVVGNDERGVLFGVGRLLRELRMDRGKVAVPADFHLASAPRMSLRGHQLGYRPKTNSYDGWDLDQWDRYIRDLAVFGTNAIELIPPRSDDNATSPHFPRPPMEMMVGMSRLADDYGLDVWIWYPAMDRDYADPKTVESALKEWGEVFAKLPRIDAVFVPGGDPGHTRPKVLMALLEKQAESLRRHHPKAQMWVSPQSFDREWLDEFLAILRDEPAWLAGVVFGPQVRVGLAELRAAVPSRYPIRGYPDITHTINCQHPVPDWDLALALTHDREPINPRPLDQAAIFRMYRDKTVGFLTYSEGCNDDVNKFVWSGLGWDPDAKPIDLLRQYARYFIGDREAEGFAQGLLALERNWRGPLLTNAEVETTLHQFQEMERTASPRLRLNWRFQQALYRAYYDAYVRDRLIAETAQGAEAISILRDAQRMGSLRAMEAAEAILARAATHPVSLDRRARVFELAEALFQSIRMQLSVPRYRGAGGRGTTLDTLGVPLNDRAWLADQFAAIRKLDGEGERLRALRAVLDRTDPGPGGFYDDLGDPSQNRHLVRGAGFADDPDFRRSSYIGFDDRPGWPMAWCRDAQSLVDAPLEMHYDGLDRSARYRVRIVYGGDNFRVRVRLDADGREVHPLIAKPNPPRPVEFDLPVETTADGTLTFRWTREPGLGGNGRGCQVAEVWLIPAGQ